MGIVLIPHPSKKEGLQQVFREKQAKPTRTLNMASTTDLIAQNTTRA